MGTKPLNWLKWFLSRMVVLRSFKSLTEHICSSIGLTTNKIFLIDQQLTFLEPMNRGGCMIFLRGWFSKCFQNKFCRSFFFKIGRIDFPSSSRSLKRHCSCLFVCASSEFLKNRLKKRFLPAPCSKKCILAPKGPSRVLNSFVGKKWKKSRN